MGFVFEMDQKWWKIVMLEAITMGKNSIDILKLRQIIAAWKERLDKDPNNATIKKILDQKKVALKNLERGIRI